MAVEAVLFDLDNTLTDRNASLKVFALWFYVSYRSDFEHGVTIEQVTSVIQEADGGGYRPLEQRWQILQVGLSWRRTPSAGALKSYWYSELGRCAQPTTGLRQVLNDLKKRGVRTGIITNGPTKLQHATLTKLGVRAYMSTVQVSEEVGIRKPDPAIFHRALAEIDVMPESAWFVGDHPSADVIGAADAGLTGVWVRGFHPWPLGPHQPHYIIERLPDLLPLLPIA